MGPAKSGEQCPENPHRRLLLASAADQILQSQGLNAEVTQPRLSQGQSDPNLQLGLVAAKPTSSSTPYPAAEAIGTDSEPRARIDVQEETSFSHPKSYEERVPVSDAAAPTPVHVGAPDNARSSFAPGDEASGTSLPDSHDMVDRDEEMEDLSQGSRSPNLSRPNKVRSLPPLEVLTPYYLSQPGESVPLDRSSDNSQRRSVRRLTVLSSRSIC